MSFLDKIEHDFEIERCQRREWTEFKGTHFHNCYEFYYLTEGEITYFVNDRIYTVKQGDVILISPYALHKTSLYQKARHTRILIYFTPRFVEEFLRMDPQLLRCFDQILFSIPDHKKMESLLQSLLMEYHEQMDLVMVKALFGQLLTLMNRWIENDEFSVILSRKDKMSETVMEIVQYMNQNYDQTLSLNETAQKFYMNASYLSRIFKKATGFCYSDYLNQLRIKKALFLLKNTEYNSTRVAMNVGFRSANHFCKTFKAVVGLTPLQYRKEHQIEL